jgi:hypothetical protein
MKKLDLKNVKPITVGKAEKYKDSLIQHVFDCIGTTNKCYAEVGAGDGINNSTVWYLREHCGWHGILLDMAFSNSNINLYQIELTKDNICPIFKQYHMPKMFDLLSIDLDSNDYWILAELLKEYKPRVIIAETNVRFNTYEKLARKYEQPYGNNNSNGWWGTSPYCYKLLGEKYGYTAVYINADDIFLIQSDCLHPDDRNIPWESVHPCPNFEPYELAGWYDRNYETNNWIIPSDL